MKTIVLKFGGIILNNEVMRLNAAKNVYNYYSHGYVPVVIVSAMGRDGDPYSTDTLIRLVKDINPNIEPRELDLIMSCGEIISGVLFHALLLNFGIPSVTLTGAQAGIITDDNFSNANVIRIKKQNLNKIIENKIIPIVSGFQGATEDGEITTLGRGTSDYTASLIGTEFKAEKIVIFKDVDGLMSADPKIVATAKNIEHISYEDVFQMAEFGAKVIHPLAVENAMKAGIPLIIKNIMNNDNYTLIDNRGSNNIISAVTYIPDRVQYIIDTKSKDEANIINEVFKTMAESNISIDLINIFPDKKIFTIDKQFSQSATNILNKSSLSYSVVDNLVKVSVIGNRMRGVPGVMAKIIKSFSESGIEILQTSDSHNSISCLVREDDFKNAVRLLHDIFKV